MTQFKLEKDKTVFIVENDVEVANEFLEISLTRKYDRGEFKTLHIQLKPDEIKSLVYVFNLWLIAREITK